MKEILPGVHVWAWPSPEKKYDFNGWYITGSDGPVMVDPPPCEEAALQEIEKRGAPKAIVLTNKDHTRRADDLAGRFRIPVLIHSADAPLVSLRIGGVFKHGEILPGGLEVHRVADAKSPGESALLLRRASALIVGDAVIGVPAGSLGMLADAKFSDPKKAREGLRPLLNLPFDALLTGDGAPILRGGKRLLEEFLGRA